MDAIKGLYTQKRYFQAEYKDAERRLCHLGGVLLPGVNDYEAFTYKMQGLHLIFYPHKTSSGHYHIRVRTQGKYDPDLLFEAIKSLRKDNYTCTFQFPANKKLQHTATRSNQHDRSHETSAPHVQTQHAQENSSQ